MATIKFFLQSQNNPAGIYVRLRDGVSVDAKAKTKFAINPDDWSKTKGQPKSLKAEGFKKLNNDLVSLKSDLLTRFNADNGKVPINSQWLKDFITPPVKQGEVPFTLVEYFDYYLLHKKSTLKDSSYKKINVYKHLVERFQKTEKKRILISEVDADFKLRFEKFCQQEAYSHNTIARAVKFIKTICYHSRQNGVPTHFQLDGITAKYERADKIFLTPSELDLIKKAKFDNEYLTNARDWLVISCETAQRVSDLMRFSKDMIRIEGNIWLLEFQQVKTGKMMSIPLSTTVKNILAERNGDFPRSISDQRYNEYIKEVCRIAGLTHKVKGSLKDPGTERKVSGMFEKWQLVSSHIGRRSYANNNFGIIPTSLLRYATGHSTERMFLEYIGKTENEQAFQLAEYIK